MEDRNRKGKHVPTSGRGIFLKKLNRVSNSITNLHVKTVPQHTSIISSPVEKTCALVGNKRKRQEFGSPILDTVPNVIDETVVNTNHVELIGNKEEQTKLYCLIKKCYRPELLNNIEKNTTRNIFDDETSKWFSIIHGARSIGKKTLITQIGQILNIAVVFIKLTNIIEQIYQLSKEKKYAIGSATKYIKATTSIDAQPTNNYQNQSRVLEHILTSIISAKRLDNKHVLYVIVDLEQWFEWNRALVVSVLSKMSGRDPLPKTMIILHCNKSSDYSCRKMTELMPCFAFKNLTLSDCACIGSRLYKDKVTILALQKIASIVGCNLRAMINTVDWLLKKENAPLDENYIRNNLEWIESLHHDPIENDNTCSMSKLLLSKSIAKSREHKVKTVAENTDMHIWMVHQNIIQRGLYVNNTTKAITDLSDLCDQLSNLQVTPSVWSYDSRVESMKELQVNQLTLMYDQLASAKPFVRFPSWYSQRKEHQKNMKSIPLTSIDRFKSDYVFTKTIAK